MKRITCLLLWLCAGVGSMCGIEPAEFKSLKAAAEKGEVEAMFQLSTVYRFDENRVNLAGPGGDPEILAQEWCQRAAEGGHAEAMRHMAIAYRFSVEAGGLGYDESKMLAWLTKSADAGHGVAMMELAEFHEGRDAELAADWYKKAVAINHPKAFGFLAYAYLDGKGVPYNPKRAIEWLTKGTQAPNDPMFGNGYAVNCMTELGKLYLDGKHVPKDEATAAGWLQQAVAADDREAKLLLADLHVRGAGVPRDLAKARELIETSGAEDYQKKPVLMALAAAEKTEAETRAMRERVADLAPRVGSAWANRLLVPPPELAGLEPVDVLYLMKMKVAPPAGPNLSVDHNKFIPGTISFSSMRMSLAANDAEADEAQRNFATRYGGFALRIRGSDLTGGRVMLGWTAWIAISDWWPEGYGYPNEGVGYCYGAASLDEALKVAYASALRELRKVYQGPIRCIQIEAGISAKPKWDLYKANKTASDVCILAYSFVLETPSTESEARKYGFTMNAPEDPEEFPRFARVTMRQRLFPQVIPYLPPIAPFGDPRVYGSYGLANAPVPINPRPYGAEGVRIDPSVSVRKYLSDEPPSFTILPFGK